MSADLSRPLLGEMASTFSQVDMEMTANERKLKLTIALCFTFMMVELVGGFIASSIAIMTDAAHMLSDMSGLVLSFVAMRMARKNATVAHSYGFHQAEILGALSSVFLVWFMTGGLVLAAIERCMALRAVDAPLMVVIAAFGLVSNVAMMMTLGHSHGADGPCHGHGGHGHDHGGGHGHAHGGGCGHDVEQGHGRGAEKGHGHSHSADKGHGHSHGKKETHGHDHGSRKCDHHSEGEKHGHGTDKDHGHSHGEKCESSRGHAHGEKAGHGHGADAGHGHAHGEKACHGHGHGADAGHGHAHGKKVQAAPLVAAESHSHAAKSNILLDAATVHILGDLLQNVGVLVAGVMMWWQPCEVGTVEGADGARISAWYYADPLCTLLFAVLVMWTTRGPLLRAVNNIMAKVPSHIDSLAFQRALEQIDHVASVHDLHIWSIGSSHVLCTAHVVVDQCENCTEVLYRCGDVAREHAVDHTTFQLEVDGLFDHSREDYGGVHGHEYCCGPPARLSPQSARGIVPLATSPRR